MADCSIYGFPCCICLGFATKSKSWSDKYLQGIGNLLAWISKETGVKAVAPSFIPYPSSYGNSKVRMSCKKWLPFNGVCGHMHVAGNDHGKYCSVCLVVDNTLSVSVNAINWGV